MTYCEKMYEIAYPLAYLHSADKTAGTHASSWVSLKNYHRAWIVLDVGDMNATATLDLKLQEATDTSGTSAKDISGKAITQLTQAGGDDNSLVCIELQTEELDVANNFDCIRAQVTVANANVQASLIVYGVESRFEPVPTTNWTETVS